MLDNSQFVTILGAYYPLTSTNFKFFKESVTIQPHKLCKNLRLWSIFGNMPLFERAIFDDMWKKCQFVTICWPFLPLNFCKLGLNDLKISERLLFYELCIISKNDENSTFFALMALLHSFGSNLAMSKDFGNCYMKNFDIARNVKGERMQSVRNQALETHRYLILIFYQWR